MPKHENRPARSDAQSNRNRILEVALTELTRSKDVPLSLIAKKVGVGQGTLYRHFPDREALVLAVYQHETEEVAATAAALLRIHAPDRALREWMDHLARYAITKAGLADAVRQATARQTTTENQKYAPVTAAAELLLRAGERAGTIRPGVSADDFFLAVAGLWQLDSRTDWQPKLAWLLDLVMDGLRVGAPNA
ncbi:TetR family transcriptional regulator [Rhodococcus sp. 15-725-2-2b]|uniref:TetR/AcrR family transcriptional regulator n=1 Tax=unclassified Rhodococcus (in: high G+C Gram-positive bacteria) TaxID=192944 RepID=UPI000B9C6D68|nr:MULTISPECIES: TetR/AcrR family transcriptional regulator [unclassified Rhodococcus (in: high G+C Gram-positive bacteria)]OZC63623.1 TetR family transcriptional regulator [Rhodococcus sp. 06-469-3-2]OZD40788.1 TetR family transcriptional regulator [Rhodococcus sp. 06-1477-1A]OZE67104.1 TetR family transcriptional regulator [Rhodococcus sp. 15-725-2-2b]